MFLPRTSFFRLHFVPKVTDPGHFYDSSLRGGFGCFILGGGVIGVNVFPGFGLSVGGGFLVPWLVPGSFFCICVFFLFIVSGGGGCAWRGFFFFLASFWGYG